MQQELLDSSEKYVALVGGYGSGKTLAAAILGHLLSISVPGNMGIVFRRSLPKLHDATERIYLEVLERSGERVIYRELRDGWPHRILYGNGSEVFFRETKDLGRFLGPEYGWFLGDEMQEEPEKTMKDLMGRLRLPRASRFLKGMICTNPPSDQHWIAKMFPQPGTWSRESLVDGRSILTTYRMIRSSTRGNPFLDPEYVAGLLQTHSPSEVRRIIEGFYGFVVQGRPVFPQFGFERHVGDPPARTMTLVRSWDFGFHAPAVTFHQMFRCQKRTFHWLILHEYLGQDILSEEFAMSPDKSQGVLPETQRVFPEVPPQLIADCGDASGAAVSERGPGPIIRLARPVSEGGYGLSFRYRKFADIDPGLDLIRDALRTRCRCGYYQIVIHRRCRRVIEALAGGYHFPQERPGKAIAEKPVKDGVHDNVIDTTRYAGELYFRPALIEDSALDEINPGQSESAPSWAWMGT